MKIFKRNRIVYIGIICSIAFLIRLFFILQGPAQGIEGDELQYLDFATSIMQGTGFSMNGKLTSFYPPLYSYFLAMLFKLTGANILSIKIIQAFFMSLLCIPLFYIA